MVSLSSGVCLLSLLLQRQHSGPTGILSGFYLRISLSSFGAFVNDTALNILVSVVCY